MSFQNLNAAELKEVAEFFAVDVIAANEDKPTKKELVAALAAGDKPVTWDDYKDVFLVAKETGQDKAPEVKAAEAAAKSEPDPKPRPVEEVKPVENEEERVLVKYERQNPSYEILGFTFTQKHPFKAVPISVAEHLIRNVEGFRLALPSEAVDYYN